MSGTLIIPDIHTEHEWIEDAISALAPEKVVFLGDYFDSVHESNPEQQQRTAEWLMHSLAQPNRVHLLGNHDALYAFQKTLMMCSGYSEAAHSKIVAVLGENWGERLQVHHWEQGWLLTHAGVHRNLWPGTVAEFDAQCAEARHALLARNWHRLLNCGWDRGGEGTGGLLWLDFYYGFAGIPGVPQIFGHTKCVTSYRKNGDSYELVPLSEQTGTESVDVTENWNLDTECAWLGHLVGGKLDLIHNRWHTPKWPRLKEPKDSGSWKHLA